MQIRWKDKYVDFVFGQPEKYTTESESQNITKLILLISVPYTD